MPDVTMCGSDECFARASCYRNAASGTKPSDFRQSYFMFDPGYDEKCDYYWPTVTEPETRQVLREKTD